MDSGDGSQRSRPKEEEMAEKGAHMDEIGCGTHGSSSVSGILGSVDESVEFETSEKSVEKPGINGCFIDSIRKIITSVEMNGENIGTENAKGAPWKGIGSPEDISNGLENVGSQLKYEGMEKVEKPEKMVQFDEAMLDVNGTVVVNEIGDSDRHWDLNGKGIVAEETFHSSPNAIGSPPGGFGMSPTEKCYWSKIWMRIRRDPAKDGGGMEDPSRLLERVLSNAKSVKPPDSSVESKHRSEGSGSPTSVNSTVRNLVFPALPDGTAFSIGTDSENSEDRGSKSSTAASAPRLRLGVSQVTGSAIEKGKMKNWNAVHRTQQGKGKVKARKKLRGGSVKFEKENSYSSVESDLRSSNVVFVEIGVLSKDTNGCQKEASSYFNGENDEVQLYQLQSSEKARGKCYRKNGEEAKVVSRGIGVVSAVKKNEASMNNRPHMDYDPLAESIILLQAAEEALEREIRKFREIRREPISLLDTNRDITSSAKVPHEEIGESNPIPQITQIAQPTQKVSLLEHELDEAKAKLKARESLELELMFILSTIELPKERTEKYLALLKGMCRDRDIDLVGLFKNKTEVEAKHLMMDNNTQEQKIMAERPSYLLERQKSMAENQGWMDVKLRDAEEEAAILRRQAKELEASNRALLEFKDDLKMKNDICKFTFCCFTQLLMLCTVFTFFLLQMYPRSHGIVPT